MSELYEMAIEIQKKINEIYPPDVMESINKLARMYDRIPMSAFKAMNNITDMHMRALDPKIRECADLIARMPLPNIKLPRISMANTERLFAALKIETDELAKQFQVTSGSPADELKFTAADIDPIEISDDSPVCNVLAETAATLQDAVDDIKKRVQDIQTAEACSAADETSEVKWEYVVSMALIFMTVVPQDIELAANTLWVLTLHVKTFVFSPINDACKDWSGIIGAICLIITLADFFLRK
jgi:hypothetical protein